CNAEWLAGLRGSRAAAEPARTTPTATGQLNRRALSVSFFRFHPSCLLLQPLAAIDDLRLAGQHHLVILAPFNFEPAAGHVDAHAPVGQFIHASSDGSSARARAR